MIYFLFYLADIVENAQIPIMFLAIILTVAILVLTTVKITASFDKDDYSIKYANQFLKKLYPITLILLFLSIFMPQKITIYQMIGVYNAKALNSNVQVTDKIEKILKIIDLELDNKLKSLDNE